MISKTFLKATGDSPLDGSSMSKSFGSRNNPIAIPSSRALPAAEGAGQLFLAIFQNWEKIENGRQTGRKGGLIFVGEKAKFQICSDIQVVEKEIFLGK